MDLEEFLAEWNNGSDKLLVHTSGSTGKPKPMWVEKSRMAHSARTTCRFLGLKKGDTALLCMPLDYIAGKMMAVRAIEWGLNLICVEPSGHPFSFKVDELTRSSLSETKKQVDKLVPLVDELTSSKVDKLCDSEANNSSTCQLVNSSTNTNNSSTCQLVNSSTNTNNSSTCQLVNSSTNIVFSAMTPMQVYNSLQVPEERERLMQITHLIIGGGAIDEALESELKSFPNNVWSTYGMTETLSHIALRRISCSEGSEGGSSRSEGAKECRSGDEPPINNSLNSLNSLSKKNYSSKTLVNSSTDTNNSSTEKWYTPFPDVSVSLNEEGCLVIDAPGVCAEPLATNDCAIIHDDGRRFRIIGRKDNVINSGGIKIHAEEVEKLLRPYMPKPYIICKDNDSKFGEIVVLVYEVFSTSDTETETNNIISICRSVLPKYWLPRRYLPVAQILLTETGKPRRDVNLYR